MPKPLNVAMIGYGFMGKAHSNAYRQVNRYFPELEHQPVLKCLCARSEDKARSFAETWGYESIETDWRKTVARDDVDLVDIGSPNVTHAEIAIEAAKHGKWVACEKPLAGTLADARRMRDAARRADGRTFVGQRGGGTHGAEPEAVR